MRFTLAALAALTGLTLAAPAELISRQSSDPNACQPEGNGYGPIAQPNTDTGFTNYPPFAAFANFAPTPQGYTRAFTNLQASVQGSSYMGLIYLTSYNTTACSSVCSAISGCRSFNIFFERDPTVDPAPACPNPFAQTDIKCTLFGSAVSSSNATNVGQYRENFHVVIAGSDGYNAVSS